MTGSEPSVSTTAGGRATGLVGLSTGWKFGPLILWHASTTMTPSLEVEAEGIRYRVLRPDFWPFSEIGCVDRRRMVFGIGIAFVARRGRRFLWARMTDRPSAARLLATLPPDVRLTPEALALRED